MKYIVLYDTLINKTHTPKGTEITFEAGTDEGYIKRLLANKVIAPLDSSDSKTESKPKDSKKQAKKKSVKQETQEETQESEAEQEL